MAFASIDWSGQEVRIEYQWLNAPDHARPQAEPVGRPKPSQPQPPMMVFLHEGLGSLSMWRDYPHKLCELLGWRGLVYSRPGYGKSTARGRDEAWGPDFMHQQALQVLPALLQALDIDTAQQPLWLFGHSDGGSIALLYAAHLPFSLAGAIVLAPHIVVEELSVQSIAQTRQTYLEGDLRQRLARHHDDPDSAFWGWNDVWLLPHFARWSIAEEISQIRCPLLAVQGLQDEYGTLAQITGIQARVPHAQLLTLPACGHSPHRDQPQALNAAVAQFVLQHAQA